MRALWDRMAVAWPIVAPEPVLAELVGPGVLDQLTQLRLLQREPLRAGARFPCDDCPRGRVVVEHEGAWAVCSCPPVACEPVDVSAVDLLTLDPHALVHRLRELLGLDGPFAPPHWRRVALLGERRLGAERVVFGLVPRPRCVSPGHLTRWLTDQAARVTVLLAPTRDARPALTPTTAGQVVWLSLEEVVDLPASTADLSELALRVPLSGADLGELLWPRFALIIDPTTDRAHYAGQVLGLDRSLRLTVLLRTLAEQAGEWVSRRDLLLALYPDEITNRGRLLTDPVKLERRIRQLVSDLGKAFKSVDAGDLPANPIENLRARSDVEGGYRLALPAHRVFIQSGGA